MTLPRQNFTYQEYMQLPDDQRYEVLEGELVMTPAPGSRHQVILLELAVVIRAFLRGSGLGQLRVAPFDVILSEHNVIQPDLIVVRQERLAILQERGLFGAPDLAVEILSPSHPERDRETKRQIYSTYGVQEYWIVDPESRSVEVLTQQGGGLETWQRFPADSTLHSPLLPGLQIDLTEIFAV